MPAFAFRIAGVRAVQLEGEECGFFATRSAPDFHDHVSRVAGIFREQTSPNPSLEPLHLCRRFRQLGFGQLLHFRVAVSEQQLRVFRGFTRLFVLVEHLHHALELGTLNRELVRLLVVGRDFGTPHLFRQFIEPIAKAF